jgi:pre-mRNA-splicing helicase BRR2
VTGAFCFAKPETLHFIWKEEMAEKFQQAKLYQYAANSNLVLEAEKTGGRRKDEGTGEVETLQGKLGTTRMGDRIDRGKRPELDDRIEKAKQKRVRSEADDEAVKKKKKDNKVFVASKGSTVLTETEDLDSINYRPKTRESRAAYEEILSFVQVSLGDQPQDILRGAADEILSLLKDESMRAPDRQKEIEKIISRQSSEKYNKLVNLGKKITDFHNTNDDKEEDEVKMDEEMGVAVIFEDDDEDAAREDLDEVIESEEEDDDEGGVEAFGSGTLKGEDDRADDGAGDDKYNLAVHDIDAYWLQRKLSTFYTDANISAKLADETLVTLQIADERACENRLVVLLDFDKFDFIKLLLKNRSKIYYCTRLKQAQTDADRTVIEKEMMMSVDPNAPLILQQLNQKASVENWTKNRIEEFTKKARNEAQALNKGSEKGVGGMQDEVDGPSDSADGRGIGSLRVQEKLVDLEGLQFAQGSHLMANKRCELPEKSWRAQKKGYEEVHVPAVRPVISSDERLVDVLDLPDWVQPAFQEGGVRTLNRIQSKMVPAALFSSENLLLCAPTSSGKTNVALLCILNQLGSYRREDGTFDLKAFKIVYIAPMKALVQECVLSFGKKLKPYGVNVRELSGDQNLTREQIEDTQLIVTTPEKWDIITRKNGERTYTQLVRLIIIDEIHLLHDDRGAVLESIVVRTLRQIENNSMNNKNAEGSEENVRLVGLSATLPNFEDVATFLRVKPDKGLFYFDNSFRPVPLQQQYIGVSEKKALKRFQIMNEICYEKVLQKAGKNQILIFTHSRIETAKTARALRDLAVERDEITQFIGEGASREILKEEAESVKNSDLKDLLPFGFAIHHAGEYNLQCFHLLSLYDFLRV